MFTGQAGCAWALRQLQVAALAFTSERPCAVLWRRSVYEECVCPRLAALLRGKILGPIG